MTPGELHEQVLDELARDLVGEAAELGWRLEGLRLLGSGLEFAVFGAEVQALGPVALRVPRASAMGNDNDPEVDSFRLLEQEATLSDYAASRGLPAPSVYLLHRGERCSFLATELIETDGSLPGSDEIGALAADLHRLEPPSLSLVADPQRALDAVLAERLARRAGVVERLAGIPFDLPAEGELMALLERPDAERRLLHMDLRPENLLPHRAGRAVIVDWSNALIGDPELELARIAEYGGFDERFATAYEERRPRHRAPAASELVYRLDTAVMLAVVFLSESPDEDRAEAQLARVSELREELRVHL